MIWFIVHMKSKIKEQLLINHGVIRHLKILVILNMMGIKVDLFYWFIDFSKNI